MKTYYYYYIKDLNNKKLNYFDPTRQKPSKGFIGTDEQILGLNEAREREREKDKRVTRPSSWMCFTGNSICFT